MQKTEKNKFYYKKHLGQNFLHDTVKINRMISAMNPQKDDIFLEIGAGAGSLTKKLAPLCEKVYAVELDCKVLPKLRTALEKADNVEIVNADFLKVDIRKYALHGKKIRIAGNVPYYITTPIIEKAIENRGIVRDMFLTVQKEVALRIAAKEGGKDYGSLSVFVQYYADAELLFKISKKAFFPEPKVDSAFIMIDFEKGKSIKPNDEKTFFRLVRGGFNQRRKTLANNMRRVFEIKQPDAEAALKKADLDPKVRAEDVSILDFAKLSDIVYNVKNDIKK
ncbi:MAG: 16S rRNA (adenine(1518)-N(6)/adenine(1519)-N(6))-dimethyltransferase RsmA [Candidatus Goldiibacteriota bacterium]